MNDSVDILMVNLIGGIREVHVIESGLHGTVETEIKTNHPGIEIYIIKSMPLAVAQKQVSNDKDARIIDHTKAKTFQNPLNGLGNLGDWMGDNPFDFFRKK